MGFLKKNLKKEESDIKEILKRIRKKDFSGNTGLAIKNSIFQFLTTFTGKIGSLFFTIILARLLLPELFGLYSLALSTILIFTSISEFGIVNTLIRFVSKALGEKNKKRARAYLIYLGKIKLALVIVSVFILILTSKFISDVYYQKPLFLALMVGVFYIIFSQITTFLGSILQASNYFRGIFYKEILFQISRIILVPLAVLFSLKYSFSNEIILFLIILFLSISYLFVSLFLWKGPLKKAKFIREKKSELTSRHRKKINAFLLIISVTVLSGLFFSFIDKIMLGRFVAGEFIGYYSAALNLVGALSSLAAFSIVLFPIFSRIRAKKLERGMKKAFRAIFTVGSALFLITLLFAPLIILIIYGSEYSPSINILRLLSLLIITLPLIGLYSAYFMSKGKPKILAGLLIVSTVINIFLNYILITSLLKYGQMAAIYGASVATILSQFLYLFGLFIFSKNKQ
jgi:O-antigen/teichoic acid export membrane protein